MSRVGLYGRQYAPGRGESWAPRSSCNGTAGPWVRQGGGGGNTLSHNITRTFLTARSLAGRHSRSDLMVLQRHTPYYKRICIKPVYSGSNINCENCGAVKLNFYEPKGKLSSGQLLIASFCAILGGEFWFFCKCSFENGGFYLIATPVKPPFPVRRYCSCTNMSTVPARLTRWRPGLTLWSEPCERLPSGCPVL